MAIIDHTLELAPPSHPLLLGEGELKMEQGPQIKLQAAVVYLANPTRMDPKRGTHVERVTKKETNQKLVW